MMAYRPAEAYPGCGNAQLISVPHPPFNTFTLVAMIVPTRMCRWPHPLIRLATPLLAGILFRYVYFASSFTIVR